MKVSVVMPTLKLPHVFRALESLRHLPWTFGLHIVTGGKTWAEAINIGLSEIAGGDVILMDDDVFLTEHTFRHLDANFHRADIFGFKLLFPDKRIQHAGGIVRNGSIGHIGYGQDDSGEFDKPLYVCHATTSLIYIKRHVIDNLGGMAEDIPGVQMEDVDFSFRALKAGFKIMYLPGPAMHMESASKKFLPNFQQGIQQAFDEVKRRHMTPEFVRELESFPKPVEREVVTIG